MRIVATSDTHFFVDPAVIPDGDVFIHAGDLMNRGTVNEWDDCLAWLDALPHQHKYFVPGNHDFHLMLYPGPAMQDLRRVGVKTVGHPLSDTVVTLPNGMTMLGSPWVTDLMRWAFNSNEDAIREHMMSAGPADIVVTHSPIHGILDEVVVGSRAKFTDRGMIREPVYEHTGARSYIGYMNEFKPLVWIHGHIHEGYGQQTIDKTGTTVYNVCLCDINYKHRNAPAIIDL